MFRATEGRDGIRTPDIAALAYTCPRCKQRVLYRDTEGTLEEAMLDLGRELELWKRQEAAQ